MDRSTAPPGTSIDCKALMNALLRRLTLSSFGADDGVESRLGLREEIFGVLGGGHGYNREGSLPTPGVSGRERSGERGEQAVVSVVEGVWRFNK